MLAFGRNFTFAEIGRAFGISEGTVQIVKNGEYGDGKSRHDGLQEQIATNVDARRTGWKSLRERIVEGVYVDASGCWVWSGAKRNKRYGCITVDGVVTQAHRASYTAFVGEIPDGSVIRHLCDNPACVNPAHLSPGSQAENVADAICRGRHISARRREAE